MTGSQGLVSVLHRNPDIRRWRFGFNARHITKPKPRRGPSDKWPVQSHSGRRTACEAGASLIDRERFTHARTSCAEPDRSVVKEPQSEPSFSSKEECLSPTAKIAHLFKKGKRSNARGPTLPPASNSHSSPRVNPGDSCSLRLNMGVRVR